MNIKICKEKFFILHLIVFVFLFGYFFHRERKTQLLKNWTRDYFNVQVPEKTENNLTYPTFKHPLAPPYPFPYKFIINQPNKCKNRKPFLVIMVLGECHDQKSRHTIRETWGNESLYDVDVVTIFLLGLSRVAPHRTQLMLEEESMVFGDIIQQDFMDTYYNLTLKTLMGMEWVTKFCPSTSYVMKIDSDMFFNVDYLVHQLLYPELPVLENFFTGPIVSNTGPIRYKKSRFYVPKEVYPNDTYPPYCAGPGYVFSVDMAKKIYDVAQEIRVIPMEDAFMGICLYELGIPPTPPPRGMFNGLRAEYDLCYFKKVIIVHHYAGKELRTIWADFWAKRSQKCK